MNKINVFAGTWLYLAVLLATVPGMSMAAMPVTVKVTVAASTCAIPPGEEEIALDFGSIVDRYLYLNKRTIGQPFSIHLTDCDLSLFKNVRVNFLGTESRSLPGLLAVEGSGGTAGIAIGLETLQAIPLPLNKASSAFPLLAGDNLIGLKAYVQGEPAAIANHTIGRGAFSAVATFSMDYQ